MTHSTLDYSGQPFARPEKPAAGLAGRVTARILAAVRPAAVGSTLLGQDSVSTSAMSRGLSVYCGYEGGLLGYANGRYTTMGSVYAYFPGKKYVSVGRDAIDIEPGLASPSAAPNFVRNAKPTHTTKPVVYCSAGDLTTVIGYLNRAGIARSKYFIWSAHWTGKHICGPGTCGYPQADATQYGSNNSFDSDVFSAAMFGPVPPAANPSFPLKEGDADVTGSGPVRQLQTRLNTWQKAIGKYGVLKVDGQFGAATKAAVADAQFHFSERGVKAGTCTSALFKKLSAAPPVTPAPAPKPETDAPLMVTSQKNVTVAYSLKVDRTIPAYTGLYATKVERAGTTWRTDHNSAEAVFILHVPLPGTYTVTTGARGYKNTVQTVIVTT